MAKGGTRITIGWIGLVFSIIGVIGTSSGSDTGEFGAMCCGVFICAGVMSSGYNAKKLAGRTVIIQQHIQPVPVMMQQPVQAVHHHHHAPMVQGPTHTPNVTRGPIAQPPTEETPAVLAEKARNLETARDWEGAAQAYQEAGMYSEAGRVRQQYLEDDEDKVVVNIDRVGDTVLHDSVMMGEANSPTNDEHQEQ